MKIRSFFYVLVLLASAFGTSARAQFEFGTTPDLHVEGNQLVDPQNHPVRFFGFMDTPSAWFNSGRWGWNYDETGKKNCKAYYENIFKVATDTTQGSFCNLFRLHLEPAWLNGSNTFCRFCGKTVTMYTQAQIDKTPRYGECKYCHKPVYRKNAENKIIDPDGQEVGGEADVHAISITTLKSRLNDVYIPIAESAKKHGMYVIMRPPGVCPGTIKVGSYYQQYLIDVWDAVTSNAKVKNYSGWLSIELANEPVRCVGADGKESKRALHDFFQPVVDKIRANGFEGIIWVPGTGWQASYADYSEYPIQDANFGYAVHNYTGWYGGDDKAYTNGKTIAQYTQQFHNQVPVVDTNPIVITEVDWSPEKKSEEGKGHINEHGDWVDGNYGTWATGNTSKWGVLYKGLLDKYTNISMTLTSTDDYMDWNYFQKGIAYPAFKDAMIKDGLDPFDGCGAACFQWYKDYYHQQKEDYSDDNITISKMTTTSIKDMVLSVGGANYLTISANFVSGRKSNVAGSCTYTVAHDSVAKVFRGKVIGLAEGETDIVATYTDITGKSYDIPFHVTVSLFPLNKESFNPAILGTGTIGTVTSSLFSTSVTKNGMAGWKYASPVDISAYDSLSVSLGQKPSTSSKGTLRIYDSPDLESVYCEIPLTGTEFTVALKDLLKTDSTALDLKNIYCVGFYSAAAYTYRIKNVSVSKANTADAIIDIAEDEEASEIMEIYNLNGMRTNSLQRGVNILRMANGKTKKIIIR